MITVITHGGDEHVAEAATIEVSDTDEFFLVLHDSFDGEGPGENDTGGDRIDISEIKHIR